MSLAVSRLPPAQGTAGTDEPSKHRLENLTADRDTARAQANGPVTIANRSYDQQDVINVLGKALNSIPEQARETKRVPIGIYRGLRFGLVIHPQYVPEKRQLSAEEPVTGG